MASVNYIYSVSTDTLNGRVNPVALSQEIAADPLITIAIDYINVLGNTLNIWFKASLSPTEQTELTVVVGNHTGQQGVTDTPDTIIAQLTQEGRNLLARAKLGDIVYRQVGWQLGRSGYITDRPVKVTPFSDTASTAEGYFELLDNSAWNIGTYISLNGKRFIYGTHFLEGLTAADTLLNIQDAVLDSTDPEHYRLVETSIDPAHPNRLYVESLIIGDIGNSYPLSVYHVGATINFSVTSMAGGSSLLLEDPSWPTPPMLDTYIGTDGFIEQPSSTSVSFLSRLGEGTSGIGSYGELGLWCEVLSSNFSPEIGRQILFAMSHFPIQPKTDRTILTFRLIISF